MSRMTKVCLDLVVSLLLCMAVVLSLIGVTMLFDYAFEHVHYLINAYILYILYILGVFGVTWFVVFRIIRGEMP